MAGRMINGAAALAELIRPASDTGEFGTRRVLPVLPELSNLLPSRGLRRGSTIAIGVTPGSSVHQGALPTSGIPDSAGPPLDHARDLGDFGLGARRRSPRSALPLEAATVEGSSGDSSGEESPDGSGAVPRAASGGGWAQDRRS